jgi:hypothetical protein
MKLEEAAQGQLVEYTVIQFAHAKASEKYGFVVSTNDIFVFVRYGLEQEAKATYPQDLRVVAQ